ncbi:MAG: ABC transporter ATP-binding protein [Prevotellaceae bacterium]|jgi:ABC-2 type transport system ATP-binding protein|nr:ABC transporter ATP-binding protein [Prevotellaceae bacterium]
MLKINNLSKSFDNIEVLNIPQLNVKSGELVGIVGNNGAGKTTLFRLCLDLLKAEKGSVSIENQDVSQSETWKNITGSFIDERFLIDFLTPQEYFSFIGNIYNLTEMETNDHLADFEKFMSDEILGQKKKYIEKFSKGNKQKIGIVGAMLMRPKLLILDEPFNFLDPSSQIEMKNLLQKYNREFGVTILLSSHNIQYVADICSRIIILERGCIFRDVDSITESTKQELENYFNK